MRWSCLVLAYALFCVCVALLAVARALLRALLRLLARRAAARSLWGDHCGFGTEQVRTRAQCKALQLLRCYDALALFCVSGLNAIRLLSNFNKFHSMTLVSVYAS